MLRKFDLTGQRFGRLVVRADAGRQKINGAILWLCNCDCGEQVTVAGIHLRRQPGTRSCGCWKREYTAKITQPAATQSNTRHGHARRGKMTSAYARWGQMIHRCENPNHRSYKNYGGRGIKICKRWRNSFATYYADTGDPPKGLVADRINNNGDYKPSNFRWTTRLVSNTNKRQRQPKKR